MLLRFPAVISSSIATILSSLLPLFISSSLTINDLLFMFIFLCIGAVLIHGMLTHLFNDYADHLSGTDDKSPAILSGGSRVIQTGVIQPHIVLKLGKGLAIVLLIIAVTMAFVNQSKLTILIFIGIWSAYSYSLSPFRLSYRPFLGEWLSLFPAIFLLGLAGPWMIFKTIPLWAFQNAVINAFVCMAWVMVHHIPDLNADREAIPKKRTSVVWFVDKLGLKYARIPALLYFVLAGICALWLGFDRFWAAIILTSMISYALFLVVKINPENIRQVTNYEKILLVLAISIATMLGIF